MLLLLLLLRVGQLRTDRKGGPADHRCVGDRRASWCPATDDVEVPPIEGVMVSAETDVFEEHRTYLLGVAYRLTGILADAEDAVQETWLRPARLSDADRAAIRDPHGWLTTVAGRLCLDRLRSAAVQRERYVGSWLPEPLLTPLDGAAPRTPPDLLDEVVRDEGVRMAALVVLDELTPEQRVAFVLHDALDIPFAEIADVLGCSPPTARQHASRARRIVACADPPARVGLRVPSVMAQCRTNGNSTESRGANSDLRQWRTPTAKPA